MDRLTKRDIFVDFIRSNPQYSVEDCIMYWLGFYELEDEAKLRRWAALAFIDPMP